VDKRALYVVLYSHGDSSASLKPNTNDTLVSASFGARQQFAFLTLLAAGRRGKVPRRFCFVLISFVHTKDGVSLCAITRVYSLTCIASAGSAVFRARAGMRRNNYPLLFQMMRESRREANSV